MDGQEEKQASLIVRILRYFKPHWKIIRDGFPLALYSFLTTVPLISLPIFGGHESLGTLNVVALFLATDFTLMSNVNFACGFAFQVNIVNIYSIRVYIYIYISIYISGKLFYIQYVRK